MPGGHCSDASPDGGFDKRRKKGGLTELIYKRAWEKASIEHKLLTVDIH